VQVIIQMARQVDGMQAKGNPAAIASRMARLSAKLSLWMDGRTAGPTPLAWAAATMLIALAIIPAHPGGSGCQSGRGRGAVEMHVKLVLRRYG
jgi:hypothetical protein